MSGGFALLVGPVGEDDLAAPPLPTGVHMAEAVSTLPEHPLPLCWIAEGKQRGATDDEWAIAFDHESLPAVWVTENRHMVGCPDCREWMHA